MDADRRAVYSPAMSEENVRELMRWYLDAGVDETVSNQPVDRFAVVEQKIARAPEPAKAVPEKDHNKSHYKAQDTALPRGAEAAIHDAVEKSKNIAEKKMASVAGGLPGMGGIPGF